MITRFTLVRHGETAWNVSGRWQGHAHVPLNEAGRKQAALLAAHQKASGTRFDAVVTSDSLRAFETGRVLASALDVPLLPDARLREIDLGEWQGLTSEEVKTWDAERYLDVEHDPWHVKRPGGESGLDVGTRMLGCLDEHADRHAGGHLIAVSHGGSIRNLLQQLGLARADRLVVGNTSCSVLVRTLAGDGGATWTLECFNELAHLGGAAARVEVEP